MYYVRILSIEPGQGFAACEDAHSHDFCSILAFVNCYLGQISPAQVSFRYLAPSFMIFDTLYRARPGLSRMDQWTPAWRSSLFSDKERWSLLINAFESINAPWRSSKTDFGDFRDCHKVWFCYGHPLKINFSKNSHPRLRASSRWALIRPQGESANHGFP